VIPQQIERETQDPALRKMAWAWQSTLGEVLIDGAVEAETVNEKHYQMRMTGRNHG
jgi:hypothetical protein